MNFDAERCKNHIEIQYSGMGAACLFALRPTFQKMRSASDLEAHMDVAKI